MILDDSITSVIINNFPINILQSCQEFLCRSLISYFKINNFLCQESIIMPRIDFRIKITDTGGNHWYLILKSVTIFCQELIFMPWSNFLIKSTDIGGNDWFLCISLISYFKITDCATNWLLCKDTIFNQKHRYMRQSLISYFKISTTIFCQELIFICHEQIF